MIASNVTVKCADIQNKSSAVAEMSDRFHNRHGPKRGGLLEVRSELEFDVPFQHKHGYIRDERPGMESYPYPVNEG